MRAICRTLVQWCAELLKSSLRVSGPNIRGLMPINGLISPRWGPVPWGPHNKDSLPRKALFSCDCRSHIRFQKNNRMAQLLWGPENLQKKRYTTGRDAVHRLDSMMEIDSKIDIQLDLGQRTKRR